MPSLTDDEKVLTRRYCGYVNLGQQPTAGMGWRAWEANAYLEQKMNALTPDELTRAETFYLPNLQTLEQAVLNVQTLLFVNVAAVFTRNPYQLKEYIQLFKWWRLEYCNFFGIGPGVFLSAATCGMVV
jgi:hypothetical protein